MSSPLLPLVWLVTAALALMGATGFAFRRKETLLAIVGSYELLLTGLFAAGFLIDVSRHAEGWSFLPMFAVSAPWSVLATETMANTALMTWVARGLFENYVFFVVLCGGLNCAIFFLIARKLSYSRTRSQ
jgi:hypothetical protein